MEEVWPNHQPETKETCGETPLLEGIELEIAIQQETSEEKKTFVSTEGSESCPGNTSSSLVLDSQDSTPEEGLSSPILSLVRDMPFQDSQSCPIMQDSGKYQQMEDLMVIVSPNQFTKMEELFSKYKEEEGWIIVHYKKKSNSRDPFLVSPAATRSRNKAEGVKPKTLGKKRARQIRQEEASKNIADGTQKSIHVACTSNKK